MENKEKVKIKYISALERFYPTLKRSFPSKVAENNIIEINKENLRFFINKKIGRSKLWELVEEIKETKEIENTNTEV